MTKKKTKVEEPVEQPIEAPEEETEQLYVVLTRIIYKAMIPGERKYIDPAPDPYADDAPRITLEHLSAADVNRLIMRRIVAPLDK